MVGFLVNAETTVLFPTQCSCLIPLHEGQPCLRSFRLLYASRLKEVWPLCSLYSLPHYRGCTICIPPCLIDEGQSDVRQHNHSCIGGLFTEPDSFLEQGCCGVQMVPLAFKMPPDNKGWAACWLVFPPLKGLLKCLTTGLICLIKLSLHYLQVS